MLTKDFILAGNAIFTVELPESRNPERKPHYTFRCERSEGNAKYPPAMFVNLLAGPDNTQDYIYLGMMNEQTGQIRTTHASSMDASAFPVVLINRVLARIFTGDVQPIIDAGFKVHHEGRCGRCGRPLTTPESIASGIGPVCAGKE